jgi:hypothetical protein
VTLEIRFAEDGPGGGGVPEVYYVSKPRGIAGRVSLLPLQSTSTSFPVLLVCRYARY